MVHIQTEAQLASWVLYRLHSAINLSRLFANMQKLHMTGVPEKPSSSAVRLFYTEIDSLILVLSTL